MNIYIICLVATILLLPIITLLRYHPYSCIKKFVTIYSFLVVIASVLVIPIWIIVQYKFWALFVILIPFSFKLINFYINKFDLDLILAQYTSSKKFAFGCINSIIVYVASNEYFPQFASLISFAVFVILLFNFREINRKFNFITSGYSVIAIILAYMNSSFTMAVSMILSFIIVSAIATIIVDMFDDKEMVDKALMVIAILFAIFFAGEAHYFIGGLKLLEEFFILILIECLILLLYKMISIHLKSPSILQLLLPSLSFSTYALIKIYVLDISQYNLLNQLLVIQIVILTLTRGFIVLNRTSISKKFFEDLYSSACATLGDKLGHYMFTLFFGNNHKHSNKWVIVTQIGVLWCAYLSILTEQGVANSLLDVFSDINVNFFFKLMFYQFVIYFILSFMELVSELTVINKKTIYIVEEQGVKVFIYYFSVFIVLILYLNTVLMRLPIWLLLSVVLSLVSWSFVYAVLLSKDIKNRDYTLKSLRCITAGILHCFPVLVIVSMLFWQNNHPTIMALTAIINTLICAILVKLLGYDLEFASKKFYLSNRIFLFINVIYLITGGAAYDFHVLILYLFTRNLELSYFISFIIFLGILSNAIQIVINWILPDTSKQEGSYFDAMISLRNNMNS